MRMGRANPTYDSAQPNGDLSAPAAAAGLRADHHLGITRMLMGPR